MPKAHELEDVGAIKNFFFKEIEGLVRLGLEVIVEGVRWAKPFFTFNCRWVADNKAFKVWKRFSTHEILSIFKHSSIRLYVLSICTIPHHSASATMQTKAKVVQNKKQ